MMQNGRIRAPPSRGRTGAGAVLPSGGAILPRELPYRRGEIEAIVITNNPLIFGRPIFINIFNNTISSQTLVHLLCSIFVLEPQIGTCGWVVVLIHLVVDASWFIWWKIICSDPLCYLISFWSWAWILFVSSSLVLEAMREVMLQVIMWIWYSFDILMICMLWFP